MSLDIRWVASPNNSGGHYDKWFVCIHATVTRETSDGAELVAGWFADPDFDASTQYIVDRTDIIQTVAEHAYAWSAGTTANKYGIHIELVAMPGQTRGEWADAYSEDELRLAARLTAQLCAKHGIPVRKIDAADLRAERGGICGHADVRDAWHETTHWDPGPNFPWGRFIDYVREAAQEEEFAMDKEAKAAFDAQDDKLDRILQYLRFSRQKQLRIMGDLNDLEESVTDDATKAQVRRIRADLLAAIEGDDASPQS